MQLEQQSETHYEIIAILFKNPKLLQEYKRQLEPMMFYEYAPLYNLMLKVDEEEGLTFKGVTQRIQQADNKERLQGIISNYYISASRLPSLVQQAKKILLAENLRVISKKVFDVSQTDPDEGLRLLKEYADKLYTTDTEGTKDMSKQVDEWLKRKQEMYDDPTKRLGMITGIQNLDAITKGFKRKTLNVIGAFTSMGKSAFEIELAIRLKREGYKGAIFSLEMSADNIYDRISANIHQITLEKVAGATLTEYDFNIIKSKKERLQDFYIEERRGIDSSFIRDTIRTLKREQGLDFVMVDYIQDLNEKSLNGSDNLTNMISRACRTLRIAASESDVAVFALSQVTRQGVKDGDHRPTNADLANSTGIETSADMIMLLHREDYWNPNVEESKKNILEVNITKHRNGRTGQVELYFDKPKQHIYQR